MLFRSQTSEVPSGSTLYWTINHGTTNSIDFVASYGSFVVNNNSGSFTVTPSSDITTEGPETFAVDIRTGSISGTVLTTSSSITINDTSIDPSYTLSSSSNTINEGSGVTFTVTTTNVSNNTTLYWTINHGTTNSIDFVASSEIGRAHV